MLVLLALPGASGVARAQYVSVSPDDVFDTQDRRYGHLQYFGFYASAMGHWNFTSELAPFTNLTWIHVGSVDDPDAAIAEMVLRMEQAREAGVAVTLSIEPFLFENARGELRPEQAIREFLLDLRATLEAEGLLDGLAMIYPKDEPLRNFVDARDPSFYDRYVSGDVYDDVLEVLVHANDLVKEVFPEIPLGVIFSGYELFGRFFDIPANYDWVGFDCYDDLFRACDDRSFTDLYLRLLDFMQPAQRLIAVPEAWAPNDRLNRADWPEVLRSRFLHHWEMALNEPRFVAVVPFLWSFEQVVDAPGLGLDAIPDHFDDGVDNNGSRLLDTVIDAGLQVKQRRFDAPNLAWSDTEASPARPQSALRGAVTGMTAAGMVSAWAIDDALPHKNLRVQLRVFDRAGRQLYKSGLQRTFIRDPELASADRIAYRTLGLHGYRHQLPAWLLQRNRREVLTLEWLIYPDGESLAEALVQYRSLRVVHKSAPAPAARSARR